MTFDTIERSATSGRPLELYKFTGTYSTYRFTSWDQDVTNSDGTYNSIPIKRTKLEAGTQENDIYIDIELPFNEQIVTDYVTNEAPPGLTLEVWKVHPDDFNDTLLIWTGEVISWTIEKRIAKLRVPSKFSYLLNQPCPRPRYQAPCNHIFGDEFCQFDLTTVDHDTTISSISENTIVVADNPFADDLCNSGEMIVGSERRMIIDNVGTTFTISSPFSPEISVSDAVKIIQGCDRSPTRCKALGNLINYGGFPFVPTKNPFKAI